MNPVSQPKGTLAETPHFFPMTDMVPSSRTGHRDPVSIGQRQSSLVIPAVSHEGRGQMGPSGFQLPLMGSFHVGVACIQSIAVSNRD